MQETLKNKSEHHYSDSDEKKVLTLLYNIDLGDKKQSQRLSIDLHLLTINKDFREHSTPIANFKSYREIIAYFSAYETAHIT